MDGQLGRLIGKGGACEVYEYDAGKVVKLYFEGYGKYDVQREYDKTLQVWKQNLPVPEPVAVINLNGRYGLVMERIEGESLLDRLVNHILKTGEEDISVEALVRCPETFEHARMAAYLLSRIHSVTVDGFPDFLEGLQWAASHNAYLTDQEKARVLDRIDRLPKENCLCHGDPNPGNMIMNSGKITLIDWVNSGIGSPMCDLAEFILMFRYPVLPSDTPRRIMEFLQVHAEGIIKVFLEEYRRLTRRDVSSVEDWMVPMMVSKLWATAIPHELKVRIAEDLRGRL